MQVTVKSVIRSYSGFDLYLDAEEIKRLKLFVQIVSLNKKVLGFIKCSSTIKKHIDFKYEDNLFIINLEDCEYIYYEHEIITSLQEAGLWKE